MDSLKLLSVLIISILVASIFVRFGFQEATIVILFMLAVLVVTQVTSHYIFGIIASLLSVLIFNFFFTEPLYSFSTHQPDYIMTFFVLFVASMFSSALTSKLKKANKTSQQRFEQISLVDQINQTFNLNEIEIAIQKSAGLMEKHFACKVRIIFDPAYVAQSHEIAVELRIAKKFEGFVLLDNPSNLDSETIKFSQTLSDLLAQNIDRKRLIKKQVETDFEIREQKLRNNLLSAISHDLRTPLATVIGSVDTLIENDIRLKAEDRSLLLNNISEDARWLIDSVENILSFIRVEEHLQLNRQLESIEELFGDVVSHVIGQSKHHLVLDLPSENLLFSMDIKLMEKVLINLIQNAIKYAPEPSTITLKAYTKNQTMIFEVIDEGLGISDEMKNKVFERFVTEESPNTTKRKGLGLGLAICKAIVEAHQGRIQIKDNPRGGTIVKCVFPLKEITV